VQTAGSRAILLYGPGESARHPGARAGQRQPCPRTRSSGSAHRVDDPESFLLSNLEQRIISRLDPGNLYFRPYQEYLSQNSRFWLAADRPERWSAIWAGSSGCSECYRAFVEPTGAAPW